MGIKPTASDRDIKATHIKLAKKYHPDLNQNDQSAREKFEQVQIAYEILSDETKRYEYDQSMGFGGKGESSFERTMAKAR